MNIISPFGRVSRKGYISVIVPVILVVAALHWISWDFAPAPSGLIGEGPQTPWLRWRLIADPLAWLLLWVLFCAAAKRLHDFRWSGSLALPLLWPWPRALMRLAFTDRPGAWDLGRDFGAIERVGIGLQVYGLALLIVLAVVPGRRRPTADRDAVA
jgi:uncharacterized membrane protein YhaH (DUF805 family)